MRIHHNNYVEFGDQILSTFRFVEEEKNLNDVFYNSKEECERTELYGCECMVTDIESEMCTGWQPL